VLKDWNVDLEFEEEDMVVLVGGVGWWCWLVVLVGGVNRWYAVWMCVDVKDMCGMRGLCVWMLELGVEDRG
jgi:hypothetical protein